jgi:small-conductance mechanosensitive channel
MVDVRYNIESFFNHVKSTLLYVWSNFWAKIVIVYFLYLLFVLFLFWFSRKFIKKIILKTSTTLDDKIIKKTKKWLLILLFLFWINVSFSIFVYDNRILLLFLKFVKTLELTIVLIVLAQTLSITKRHFVLKFKNDKEKLSLLNLLFLIVQITVYTIGLLIFLKIWDVNIAPFLASAGIMGFAVAMASQEIIKNFISGIILFLEKPFVVWDVIKLSDWRLATVEEIWLRMTKFKTFLWDVVFIPNSKLLDTLETVRWYVNDYRKVEIEVWLPYWVDIDKTKEILMEVLKTENIFKEDSLEVFVSSLWDWSVNFKLRWDVEVSKYDRKLPHRLYEKVYNKVNEVWIGFPFPTYEILVNKKDNVLPLWEKWKK